MVKDKQPKEEKIAQLTRKQQLSECGHTVVAQGNKARCTTCGQSWYGSNKHQVDMILILGRCPGPRIWGIPPYRDLDDRPIVIPQGGPPIVYNGKLLDRSHKLRWYKLSLIHI